MFSTLFLGGARIILLGVMVLYVSYVVLTLRTKGAHYQFRFDPRDPARSTARFLVWVGVQVLSGTMAGLKGALDTLEDASADVGEWVLHHRRL
jgi:hypothetical protein